MRIRDIFEIIYENEKRLKEIRSATVYFDERYGNHEEVEQSSIEVKRLEKEYEEWMEQDVENYLILKELKK